MAVRSQPAAPPAHPPPDADGRKAGQPTDGSGRRRPGRRPFPALAFALSAVAGVWLSADVAAGPAILEGRWGILWRLALWVPVWLVAVGATLRLPRRAALAAVLVVGLALRLAALAGPPPLSDDLFRYSWDGRVQLDGTDPYRYVPEDPALERLREGWLWPDAAGCAELDRPPGCTRINRPMVHTIYPPLAEAWFTVVHGLTGIDAHHKSWQVAGLVTDLALAGLLMAALRRRGGDPRWAALYALAPFPALEVVANGHVDGLAALLLVAGLAVVGLRRPDSSAEPERRLVLAGALVGAATLVKLYPAVALLGLAGGPGRSVPTRRAALTRAGLGFGVVLVVGYLPHVAAVGTRVLGYLPGYLQEERYDEGSRFLLVGLVARSAGVAQLAAVLALAAVAAWVAARRPDPAVAGTVLLGALLLVTTPVQPWYAVALLAVATLARRPAWAAVAVGGYPYFFAVILDHPHAAAIGQWGYGLALAVVVADAAARAHRRRRATLPPAAHHGVVGT